jgi:hypothetical protein
VEKLAKEYGLGISLYFGEFYLSLWDVSPDKKLSTLRPPDFDDFKLIPKSHLKKINNDQIIVISTVS